VAAHPKICVVREFSREVVGTQLLCWKFGGGDDFIGPPCQHGPIFRIEPRQVGAANAKVNVGVTTRATSSSYCGTQKNIVIPVLVLNDAEHHEEHVASVLQRHRFLCDGRAVGNRVRAQLVG